MMLYAARTVLEFARGRHEAAMTAQRAAESIQRGFATRHILASPAQARTLEVLVRLGETDLVQRALDEMDEDVRATSSMRIVEATLRLAQEDPEGAAAALDPIFAAPIDNPRWEIQALLLKASSEDALGDTGASARALEGALELAEPDGLLLPFLLHPTPELLERHSRLRTTHASLISDILSMLAGRTPAARPGDAEPPIEPLSETELRVLRYLPTNLLASEIAPNYSCRATRSAPMSATCTSSSGCTTAQTRSTGRASSACSRRRHSGANRPRPRSLGRRNGRIPRKQAALEHAATTFSRVWAPPPPLISHPDGVT
jgi:LuxR family maltose regulon positive regulatory protein